jgi:putative membrane protein insertion efficiency factor
MGTLYKKIKLNVVITGIRLIKIIFLMPEGTCNFKPTCSHYAVQAVSKYSFFKAIILIIWRVIRCNPFSKGGYDPVI